MMNNVIGVVGFFSDGISKAGGQEAKTCIITQELREYYGDENVVDVDTTYVKKYPLHFLAKCFNLCRKCGNIIIMPASNGLKLLSPFFFFMNKIYRRKLHYVVIGGWLPEFLLRHKMLAKMLKNFDGIYVETNTMKRALESQDFKNVVVMPNCKPLKILDKIELVYPSYEPYKLCTFSRVMKEKGIEEAIDAVRLVNHHYGRTIYTLDIYGQVDLNQKEWFENIKKKFPNFVKYGGVIPFNESTDTLKYYYALLFPTYYDGEGFAGTLIDALASGVPVIASDWKYNNEIVKEGKTGVVYPVGDQQVLVDKLVDCYEQRDLWFSMKQICVSEAKKYLPKSVVKILINNISLNEKITVD